MTMQQSREESSRPPHYLAPHAAPTWLGRVAAFSRQMFPLYPNVLIFLLQFTVHYLVVKRVFGGVAPDGLMGGGVAADLVFGALTSVLFVYMFRVFDELKDYPTDKINFPDRPLVAGVMNIPDAHRLWQAAALALVLLQVPVLRPAVAGVFALVMAYSFFAFRWFFAESRIRPSLPLALVTHNPILYFYQLYILSFFLPWEGPGLAGALIFLMGDAMTGTAWEVSRKIRGTLEEDTYVTYSRVWGRPLALGVVAVLMIAAGACTLGSLESALGFGSFFVLASLPALTVLAFFLFSAARFLLHPERAPVFKHFVEVYKFLLLLAYIVALATAGGAA